MSQIFGSLPPPTWSAICPLVAPIQAWVPTSKPSPSPQPAWASSRYGERGQSWLEVTPLESKGAGF